MDVTKPFQSFVNGQSASPISASSSSNFVPKTSEWSEADQKYLELALSCVDSTSDTFLEQIAERVPSKTITQVARRYVAMGGDLGIKGLEKNCPVGKNVSQVSDSNKTDCQTSYCWDKVEQKSFCIGLQHFGEGMWEDIAKYCVKTKTAEQVAHYGRIYCDPKNRPRGMDLLGIPNNMDKTKKRKSKETNVVASPSLPSSADPHSSNVAAASKCELQFPWNLPSALVPNSTKSQRTANAGSGSNACAERPTKRYRDGICSGNIGQSSEHLSNMPVQQAARIPYVDRTCNNSLPGASIPSYLRPTPVENSGRSSIFLRRPSTHVLQPSQASPSSQNPNRSTQLSGITITGLVSGSVLPGHSDNLMMMNGMDIRQHGQCSYPVQNQDPIYGSNGNNWSDQFSTPRVPEGLTPGCQDGAPMLNGNSSTMNQTDRQFTNIGNNEHPHSQINYPSDMDETPVGSTSNKQLYQETLDFLLRDD